MLFLNENQRPLELAGLATTLVGAVDGFELLLLRVDDPTFAVPVYEEAVSGVYVRDMVEDRTVSL